jgi:hypothetical protein
MDWDISQEILDDSTYAGLPSEISAPVGLMITARTQWFLQWAWKSGRKKTVVMEHKLLPIDNDHNIAILKYINVFGP